MQERKPELFVATEIGKSLMASFYLLVEQDGGLYDLFHDRLPEIDQFVSWLALPNSAYLGCFRRTESTVELAGMGIIWDIQGPPDARRGTAHIAFLRKFQNPSWTAEWTGKMLDYVFDGLGLNVLYCFTPCCNHASVRFSRRLGFTHTPALPMYGMYRGKVADCTIGHLTKEAWLARKATKL